MVAYSWKQFTKRITIHASAESIYAAWSTADGLESWFLRLAEFKSPDGVLRKRNEWTQPGDRYRWLWFGHDDTMIEEREILFAKSQR